ncbi:hypothetical protein BDY17DRAFT_324081 [Neohortaea acidophila]|uniref:Long chronological lifespan protein 2 n=1 Tax=Neohortaea acidophila TaxID=245834 RepID=A0A6A6PVN1_9PEZI|nr:uncharacterized protein BDY17DRAFT_324081 [Neohortaea acidophila]KAF2483337.1 hypothetical protein BDY17DRAFT_324081 [Neohortaea acidophila]
MHLPALLTALFLFLLPASAQFQFFEQMFNQGGQQQQAQPQNMGSDSVWYQQQYEAAPCDKYLCPHTLSCVHFPHHCPCAFPDVEEKVEFGDGSMACVSKGGFKEGEALRKIELARKGLL